MDDAWSSAVTLRVGPADTYATPAHASMLTDGRVLFWGAGRGTADPVSGPFGWTDLQLSFTLTPHAMGSVLPAQERLPRLTPGLDQPQHMAFCSGQALSADGEVVIAGGSVYEGLGFRGLTYAQTFQGNTWTRVPAAMTGTGVMGSTSRWYPSMTRIPDGRILVISGAEHSYPPRANNSAELYDPKRGTWQVLASHAAAPAELYKYDYTFTALLPTPITRGDTTYELLALSERHPILFDLDQGRYSPLGAARPGTAPSPAATNIGSAAALLPMPATEGQWSYQSGAMLVVGGHDGQAANRAIDVYHPATDTWTPVATLEADQHHTSVVALPDGSLVALAGHDGPNLRALRIDPRNSFSIEVGIASSKAQRGYHNVAVLLPDGRVLVASGSPDGAVGNERADMEYYEPPYLRRPRPALGAVPAELTLGETLTINAAAGQLAELVLIALPSVTHSFDWNGRAIQLVSQSPGSSIRVTLPTSASRVPPGYYMLFGLDGARTPSVAKIVKITS